MILVPITNPTNVHTLVPIITNPVPLVVSLCKSIISCRGKSQQTSELSTKKLDVSDPKVRAIWSLKWYNPPAVPNGVYSCRYLCMCVNYEL